MGSSEMNNSMMADVRGRHGSYNRIRLYYHYKHSWGILGNIGITYREMLHREACMKLRERWEIQ